MNNLYRLNMANSQSITKTNDMMINDNHVFMFHSLSNQGLLCIIKLPKQNPKMGSALKYPF